jgi:hypothetical protein
MMEMDPHLLPPALLTVPGVSPELLESVFAASADLFSIAPWKLLNSEISIDVQAPDERLVVVMGAGEQSFGISVYDSQADLQRMYRAADPLDAAEALNWLALTYETAEYLDRGDLQAVDQYGWRVAGETAYPAIVRLGSPGPDLQAPTLQDLYWLEGCLRALCRLFTSPLALDAQGKLHPMQVTFPVETSRGLVETRLRLPGMQV